MTPAIRFKGRAIGSFLTLVGMLAAASALAPTANAQEPDSIPDVVEDIYERRSGNYYSQRSFFSQLSWFTGFGGYPEQRINRDARALESAYHELMLLQTENTATLRVPDLPNPYTTSVQLLPTSQFDSRVVGSELNFEPLPRR
ncbi:MAG: hypothetical protein AAFY72_08625 [Cyanobacteria bacterium J06649_4]